MPKSHAGTSRITVVAEKAPAKGSGAGQAGGARRRTPPRLIADDATPEPATRRGKATRDRLMKAARQVFEERGFIETRVSDICSKAGCAHGTFYIYFQSKEEVFYRLLEASAYQRYKDTAVPPGFEGDVDVRFAHTLYEYFEGIRHDAAWSRLVEQAITVDERTRDHRMHIRDDFERRIRRGIERLQREGRADPSVSAEMTAEALVSMANNFGYINVALGRKPDLDIDLAVQTLTRIWAMAIGLDTYVEAAAERLSLGYAEADES